MEHTQRSDYPTIDFNISWMVQKKIGTVIDHAEYIKDLAFLFANHRVDVMIVCDAE
jgi:hypothetical protein